MKKLFLLLLLLSSTLYSQLIQDGETALYSFKTKAGKSAVLCTDAKQTYLVYRFGTDKNIEFEYPGIVNDGSWQKFTYSYYFRGGGKQNDGEDLNYVSFETAGYTYKIYDEYYSIGEKNLAGVIVTSPEGKETDIRGLKSSVKGSLTDFRTNEKIKLGQ